MAAGRYNIIRFDERERWETAVNAIGRCDVYYYLDYCLLYQTLGDGDPYLFVYQENECQVIYPFLKRKVQSGRLSEHFYDITTAYGYGGPLANCAKASFIARFRTAFHQFCVKEKIVTEFIRFHPLLQNENMLQSVSNVKYVRDTVYVDLTREALFDHYHPSHRRNVRKALKAGLSFAVLKDNEAMSHLGTFVDLYYQTMQKKAAQSYYYFPRAYFEQLIRTLSDKVMLAVVRAEGKVIAAGLFMYDGENLHYHIGCSDRNYLHMAPNNLLFHEVAQWGKECGYKHFHLGGGYQNNDSLFRFKRGFNPTGKRRFYIGTIVHNQAVYNDLIRQWNSTNRTELRQDFFPLYRQ